MLKTRVFCIFRGDFLKALCFGLYISTVKFTINSGRSITGTERTVCKITPIAQNFPAHDEKAVSVLETHCGHRARRCHSPAQEGQLPGPSRTDFKYAS